MKQHNFAFVDQFYGSVKWKSFAPQKMYVIEINFCDFTL